MERLKNAVLIHEKTIQLSNEDGTFLNTINYRTFNFNKKAKKFEEGKGYDYEQDKQWVQNNRSIQSKSQKYWRKNERSFYNVFNWKNNKYGK